MAYVPAWLAAIAWGTENRVVARLSMPSFFNALAALIPAEVVGILIASRFLRGSDTWGFIVGYRHLQRDAFGLKCLSISPAMFDDFLLVVRKAR